MKTFTLTIEYSGEAESWEQIRNDAENNKIPKVFIGTKEFVNVVRCKDCKYWTDKSMGEQWPDTHYCIETGKWREIDFYCAKGIRKEQNDEIN